MTQKRSPTSPTFLGGAAIAFAFAVAGAALFAALTPWFTPRHALMAVAIGLGGAYTLYLLSRSAERTGRIAAIATWCIGTVATSVFATSVPLFLICQGAMIWLIRSLYFHGSIVTALMDLGVGALALASAVWAAESSGSVFLAIWCFFLVQALFVALPANIVAKAHAPSDDDQAFNRAQRSANAAMRRLSANVNHI